MNMQIEVPAGGGRAWRLPRGSRLRIIDPHGGQSGDLIAFSADGRHRMSNGRSFDYNGGIYLSTGDVIWSDRSEPMLTIVDDQVGRHDFLYACCSLEMYRKQYGATGQHANCHDSLCTALRAIGFEPGSLPNTFNFFLGVEVSPEGKLSILPPRSRPGDHLDLRTEMDLVVAVSACPASSCNGGAPPRTLNCEIG